MHHTREGTRTCRMLNACGQPDVVLAALASGLGAMPDAGPFPVTFNSQHRLIIAVPSPIARAERPDAPPPRHS